MELVEEKLPGYDFNIEGLGSEVLQFDWLKEDLFDKTIGEFKFEANFDIDKTGENSFLYHQDFRLEAERAFFIYLRSDFKMEIDEKNIYKFDTQKALITATYNDVKLAMAQIHEHAKKDFDISPFNQPDEEFWNNWIKGLCETRANRELIGDDPKNLYKDYYTFQQNYGSSLLASLTVKSIDEIFFYNPAFNHKATRRNLDQIIPPNYYLTLRNQINKLKEGPVTINFHKFIFFVVSIDCACYLLASDSADLLEERLAKMKVNEKLKSDYLRIAGEFVRGTKSNFKKSGLTIGNWEAVHDWNRLVV